MCTTARCLHPFTYNCAWSLAAFIRSLTALHDHLLHSSIHLQLCTITRYIHPFIYRCSWAIAAFIHSLIAVLDHSLPLPVHSQLCTTIRYIHPFTYSFARPLAKLIHSLTALHDHSLLFLSSFHLQLYTTARCPLTAFVHSLPFCSAQTLVQQCKRCDCAGAEDRFWHLKHFCCYECDSPLAGHKYIPVEGQPHCLACWQSKHGKVGRHVAKLTFRYRETNWAKPLIQFIRPWNTVDLATQKATTKQALSR